MIKTHTLVVTISVGNTGKQITESDIVTVKRGDIYYADLSPVVGSEQGGYRPVLIVQNDVGNKYSPTVIAAAITSRMDKTRLPTHIDVCRNDTDDSNTYGLAKDSVILLEQIRTLDKRRLREKMGHLDDRMMKQVNEAITISFGLTQMPQATTGFAQTAADGERYNAAAAASDIPAAMAVSDIKAVTDAGNGSVLT